MNGVISLKSSFNPKVLWKNPNIAEWNSNTKFAAQSININGAIGKYTLYAIIYQTVLDQALSNIACGWHVTFHYTDETTRNAGLEHKLLMTYTNNRTGYRSITYSQTTNDHLHEILIATISACTYNGNTSNHIIVPCFIIGVM